MSMDQQQDVVVEPPAEPPADRPHTGARFRGIANRYIVTPTTQPTGLRLAFDLEADGFFDTATKVHCVAIANLDSDEVAEYGPNDIATALEHYSAPIT